MTTTPATGQSRVSAVIPPAERTGWALSLLRASRAWIALGFGLVAWEVIVRWLEIPPYVLPAPSAIVDAFLTQPGMFLAATWVTAKMSLIGFGVAIVVGIALAVLMARSALFEELSYPFLNIVRVMPTVAIAPLLLIWFGRTGLPIIICSCLIAIFPIIVDVAHGLTSVEQDLINMMKLANASEFAILTRIRIPNCLPYLFSSFRVAAPGAVVGTLLGEFIGSRTGLGYLITVYSAQLNTAAVFVLALLSCLLGILFFNGCVWAERLLVPWKTVVR